MQVSDKNFFSELSNCFLKCRFKMSISLHSVSENFKSGFLITKLLILEETEVSSEYSRKFLIYILPTVMLG